MTEETVVVSRSEYEELKSENERLSQALINLQEQIRLMNKRSFGQSSEKSKYESAGEQQKLDIELLFNETEAI